MVYQCKTNLLWTRLMVAGFFGFLVAGCGNVTDSETNKDLGTTQNGIVQHSLIQMNTCDDLVTYARNAAKQRLTSQIETQKKYIENCWNPVEISSDTEFNDDMMDRTAAASDSDTDGDGDGDIDIGMDQDGDWEGSTNTGSSSKQGGGGETSHTETNVQEKGVDEADMIKTDGQYLYALSGGDLVLIEAGDNGMLNEVSRIQVGGNASELFIYGDLAVAFSSLNENDVPDNIKMKMPSWRNNSGMYEEVFFYGNYTQIAVIDISERSAPKTTRNIIYAGSYVTSRRINGSLRAVISSPTPAIDMPMGLDMYEFCYMPEAVGKAMHDAYIQETTKLIESVTLDELLPKKIDTIGTQQAAPESIVQCGEVYGPETAAGIGLLTVVSIDLDNPTNKQTDIGIMGEKGLVYASPSSLYLTTSREYVREAFSTGIWATESSGIHKFDIASDVGRAVYRATGEVEGRMLNQFCLGEKDGFLRVATTTGDNWESMDNHVSIFEEKTGTLEEVSRLSGIGEQEEIKSARFMGWRGFVVTFRNTDPLYTFDLSDPYAPKKVGEWVGPGFSTYLHPYGDNHLISVGWQDWQLAISLYDLTDFADPKMVDRFIPSGQYSDLHSAAIDDHKGFTFDANKELLAIPYHNWYNRYDTGIYLFNVSLDGFTEAGMMQLGGQEMEGDAQRSLLIGETLYGISQCRITSADYKNPKETLDTLKLYTGNYCNRYYGGDGIDGEWEDWGGDSDSDMDVDTDWDVNADTDWEESDTDWADDTDTDTSSDMPNTEPL